jgi:hypothetical protein
MTPGPAKMLALALAFVMVAAQIVCGCPARVMADSSTSAAKSCIGARPCCKQAAQSPGKSGQPCEQCNLSYRVDQMSPDRADFSVSADLVATLSPIALDVQIASILGCSQRRIANDTPAPPLLRDLFHARTLLLI